jgi:hypothetical protein
MSAKVLEFPKPVAIQPRRKSMTIKLEGWQAELIEDTAIQTGRTVKQVLQAMRINIFESALDKFIDNPDAEEFCEDDDFEATRKFFATMSR